MKHIVALSGGKDSTALALRLAEVEPRPYVYICTPTQAELPEMEEHWRKLEQLLRQPIIRLSTLSLSELVKREKMLPNWQARFCTHLLKIVPFENWILENLPCVAYVGLRADEPEREGASYGIELLIRTRYPMREWGWTVEDVLAYLKKRSVSVPRRTDCDRCPLQTLFEWWLLWRYYPERFEDASREEDALGHTYRSPGRDTWPASLRELGKRFSAGEVPKQRKRKGEGCRVCTM